MTDIEVVVDERDEAELVRAATAGDQQAFAELVGRHRNRLWAVCLRIAGNPHDAEDALQEALVAAWRGLRNFRGDAQFSTWMYRIASNAAIAQSKKRPLVVDPADREAPAPGDFTADVVWADRIELALAALPEVFRVTFVLRVYGDLSYQEIADHLEIPVQTVRSRLNRAKKALAEQLGEP
ncbi:putative RNA polymerase ECF-type sigma factor [Gordonia hirsuta DSM 44140 = NBRC 16056]|uniref:Putative RNA polymerase ECF-type sigma factor n=1 Tax=Gordonia hirsuta DSM 44140 = NBRC 16056 TaxID=1121927 RepID=L7LEE0_9ACTN|nr:sigma-70 family RNA polymerase sigma factor [Gordonia hirsuta]GAC58423.1 putative RNA polymerase ECF-type sigma factor [Gordonia hirsuta DSM 44140 = NBRC 16056]